MANPAVSIDLGIAKIIEQLHGWWKDVVARGDATKDKATRTSAQKLAVCFVRMAGLMDIFVDQLERSTANLEHIDEIARNLQHLLRSMHEILAEIEAALKTISLDWAVVNLGVLDNAAAVARSRALEVTRAKGIVAILRDGRTASIEEWRWHGHGTGI
jgi:hypothetical protein